MNSDWVIRPITNTVYKAIETLIRRKGNEGDSFILYTELKYHLLDKYPTISEEEIRKALLNLEMWGKIRMENNGSDYEIRLKK